MKYKLRDLKSIVIFRSAIIVEVPDEIYFDTKHTIIISNLVEDPNFKLVNINLEVKETGPNQSPFFTKQASYRVAKAFIYLFFLILEVF